MPTTKKSAKESADEAVDALAWLEEDANQLRVAGHGSLEREGRLILLRGQLGNVEDSRIRPREGQPWPVTAEAGSYGGTEYAQPTAFNGVPNDAVVIEGDPNRDRKAVLAQLSVERERAETDGVSSKK